MIESSGLAEEPPFYCDQCQTQRTVQASRVPSYALPVIRGPQVRPGEISDKLVVEEDSGIIEAESIAHGRVVGRCRQTEHQRTRDRL